MQLKHVPLCFVVLASICLAGAVGASAKAPVAPTVSGVVASAN